MMSPWLNVTEELAGSILMPKNARCFDYINPENGGSKLSGNVGNFLPMHAAFHVAPLLTTITLVDKLGRLSRSVARM
jgi:hypothetical protein